jgi:hypothetical protein
MAKTKSASEINWLLFFYTVPSKPVRNRVTIWRKLLKAGAVLFKGSVYVLPDSEDNYELLSWLVSEVASLKGEAAFIRVEKVETVDNQQIINLFNEQKETEYRRIIQGIEDIERKISSIRIGGETQDIKKITEQLKKNQKDYEEIKKTDFFASKVGTEVRNELNKIAVTLNGLIGTEKKKATITIPSARIEEYQGKTWATRKRPFVDRFASAWLINKFIDKKATFTFIDERDLNKLGKDVIPFDIRGGKFTHAGDLCTFEVLMKSFGLKDKTLKKIAEIVHELDIKDDKFRNPEAKGIEHILSGIRKTAKTDTDSLHRGIAVFEMLYASKG